MPKRTVWSGRERDGRNVPAPVEKWVDRMLVEAYLWAWEELTQTGVY